MSNPQVQSLTVNGTTYDIVDNTSGYMTGMTILSYGNSTWQDFIDAYTAKKVVYCRASSQSNPATGSQTRLAFMAYVNNAESPTEVEFQYYRSVSSKTESQQGDQVFIYTLTSSGSWSVITREASVKVAVGGDLNGSYSGGTYTISADIPDQNVISVDQKVTTGVNIADITINGVITELYAPQGGGSSGTITRVKTTAGAHTAIDVSSGSASFNIPTNTSHLVNDSGFITSYTDTKNTAGSTNSTSKLYLIGATEQSANPQTYSNSNLYYDSINGFYVKSPTYSNSHSCIKQDDYGCTNIYAYSSSDDMPLSTILVSSSEVFLGNRNLEMGYNSSISISDGNIYLSPGANDKYVYISNLGAPSNDTDAATKKYVDDSIGAIPAASITLNGTSTTSASFYAPTTAGTTGYYLKSNGSGAPTWAAFPTVPTVTLNGSSTTSPSFYAPTAAGTSGYVLKSNGSGAPTWGSAELTDTKNTAGSTNSTSNLYLIGATSQAANPQTYSNVGLYFDNGINSETSIVSDWQSSISQEPGNILLSVYGDNEYSISIDWSNGIIINGLTTPTQNTHAANKKYVDDNKGAQVQIVRW